MNTAETPSSQIPEKVLQFGTGILLRGLPDYFIDKANKEAGFNGRILVVKSTDGGPEKIPERDFRFNTYVRGISNGKAIDETFTNTAISRVLSAREHWPEILRAAGNKALQIIISNTTEVGLQYVAESVFQTPPASFPAKLTAFLYERFKKLGEESPVTVVIPTELVPDNGQKLRAIVAQLIDENKLDVAFTEWCDRKVIFCSSLVDRIVTTLSASIKASLKHPDPHGIQTEPYRMWAIEAGEVVKRIIGFAAADKGVVIEENIAYYRERKLRLLNGTHTISVCLGFLKGHNTVYECMEDAGMRTFIGDVMMNEILPTISLGSQDDLQQFARDVMDRFHNPFTEHKLLSITFQSTMKMKMRNVQTLLSYAAKTGKLPPLMAKGFAAYIVFSRPVKEDQGKYYGKRGDEYYLIQDDAAPWLHDVWQTNNMIGLATRICENKELWGSDLSTIPGFVAAVAENISELK